MKTILIVILLALGALVSNSYACVPAKLSTAQRFALAQEVFSAKVTSKKMLENNSLSPVSASNEAYPYQIEVTVEQSFKSADEQSTSELSASDTATMSYTLKNCGAGKAEQDTSVLVFVTDGYWYIEALNNELQTELESLK